MIILSTYSRDMTFGYLEELCLTRVSGRRAQLKLMFFICRRNFVVLFCVGTVAKIEYQWSDKVCEEIITW